MKNKTNQTVLKTTRDIFVNIHMNGGFKYTFFYFVLLYCMLKTHSYCFYLYKFLIAIEILKNLVVKF